MRSAHPRRTPQIFPVVVKRADLAPRRFESSTGSVKIEIERVDNGWTLRSGLSNEVFEDCEPAWERSSLVAALNSAVEHLDSRGSRYDSHRVYIGTEPGDKYTPPGSDA